MNARYTQEQVAELLKPPLSVKTLRRWEQAGHVPARSNPGYWLEQFADLYNVPVDSLNGKAS